jgi:hypothetical protein
MFHASESLENFDDFLKGEIAKKFVPTSVTFQPEVENVLLAVLSPLSVKSVLVPLLR